MFRLKVVQALFGDCLVLEYGSQENPRYILIDGGPPHVYRDYLKDELLKIQAAGGRIRLAVLSHVDEDHVKGLVDLLKDMVSQRKKGLPETIAIAGLWHNAFGQSLGAEAEDGLTRAIGTDRLPRGLKGFGRQARSIQQGNDLRVNAFGLKIPINAEFRSTCDRLVCVDNLTGPIELENIKVWVVGPTRAALKALQKDWEEWLAEREKKKDLPAKEAAAAKRALDNTVPNLSSIMLLVEAGGKTILLTGDGLCTHLLDGLRQAGFLHENEPFHVDVLKLPHHGSQRNVNPEFFRQVIADTYLICADGTDDNPDSQTLVWLVEAAREQKRGFKIVATTETQSIKDMQKAYEPAENGYTVEVLAPPPNSIVIDLSES